MRSNPLWEEARPFSRALAWIDLIMRAAYQDGEETWFLGETHTLERGQLVSSLRILAKEWGWSKNKVAHFLDQLSVLKMIEKRDGPNLSISIVNYAKFQPEKDEQKDSEGTTKGHGKDTSKNSNNDKKIINDRSIGVDKYLGPESLGSILDRRRR